MKSNVYLAFGQIDGIPVMKIGKANDLKRRQKQIHIDIELFFECACDHDAFVFEDRLRKRACDLGASSFKGYDWFYYDTDVYDALKTTLVEFGSEENVLKLEREIAEYQLRYYQVKVEALKLELCRKEEKIAKLNEMIADLREEIGKWKALAELYERLWKEARDDKDGR